jgi:PAS domain S-box-containing protein
MAGASGLAGLFEPVTGCLSLVLVVLFTHFFDRGFGRLAAGFASLGIAGAVLSSGRSLLYSGSISRGTVAIGAAWLCAELVSRRSQRDSAAQSKNDDLDPTVQQALAESEKEARELLDRLPGRFATRTAEDFDLINRQIRDASGTTLEGMQNLGFLRFIHPDDRERIKDGYLRSIQENSAFDTTYRWADHDGDYRWRHSRSVPYFNDDGSVYKWYAVNMDIDDLCKSREVIREREAQLNWLTENVPSLLWRTDAHGRLEYVNSRTEDYTGLRLEDLSAGGWLHLVHPDDAASSLGAWQDSLDSGRPYDVVNRFRAADNTYRWFQCKGSPVRDATAIS